MLGKARLEAIEDALRLADDANGGAVFNCDNCECDPDVGRVCRYCAIWSGLRKGWELLLALEDSERTLREIALGLGDVREKLEKLSA